jgi:DNA-binding NarL/FixJ family response regulator
LDVVNRIRVLVVDDDALVRSGLRLILGGAPGIEVVGEAADGHEALAGAREHRPDVVLMDIRMPRLNGLEATEQLCAWPDPPKVIVLTTFGADEYVVRALGAGAGGFLLKDTPPAAIVDAVHRVAAGDPILSPSVTAQLIAQLTTSPRTPDPAAADRTAPARRRLARLTERERDVALAVGRGLSNAEIAVRLHLSVPTVKAHIGRIFTKLDAENRVQVAICVHDAGLD